jgi:hypothetical protein
MYQGTMHCPHAISNHVVCTYRLQKLPTVHPSSKGLDRDLGAKVNGVSNEVAGIDFGGIDLDDCEVLSDAVLTPSETFMHPRHPPLAIHFQAQ